jgi:hypothetical protein
MHFVALNLQKPSAINAAVYGEAPSLKRTASVHMHFLMTGNFSGPKHHEIVVSKGNIIELLRPDDSGKILSVAETSVFCVVRSLLAFRLAGASSPVAVCNLHCKHSDLGLCCRSEQGLPRCGIGLRETYHR